MFFWDFNVIYNISIYQTCFISIEYYILYL
nr:MAG TPA: hypothetical protein [Caudoviricetes sp.]